MPWKECSVMDERLQLVARWPAGEQMAALCREFGISCKTGYKILSVLSDDGLKHVPTT
jgi:putative transposase